MSPDIERMNSTLPSAQRVNLKKFVDTNYNFLWNIPQEIKDIKIGEYVLEKFKELHPTNNGISSSNNKEYTGKLKRISQELEEYNKRGLIEMLKTLIHIVDVMTRDNIVWGVGRGSSVSSYVLYLIGIHDVDSYEYNLDITEFLKEI
jgi:DNA polymerase III alpha subunit